MYILGIETAGQVCGVALLREQTLLAETTLARPRAHSEYLAVCVEHILAIGSIEASQLDLIAVSEGPGSYTGLRIGVSMAKGLALACNASLVGVGSLEALAYATAPFASVDDLIVPAFDARRDEVYVQAFHATGSSGHDLRQVFPAMPMQVTELGPRLDPVDPSATIWLVGDGAQKLHLAFDPTSEARIRMFPEHTLVSTARYVAQRGLVQYHAGNTADLNAFEPSYLKAFSARKAPSIFERLPRT